MRFALVGVVLTAAAALGAPVPRAPAPDPAGRGYLGVLFEDVGSLRIKEAVADGPAAAAGVQSGDQIVNVGGQAVSQRLQVQLFLGERRPGTPVRLVVDRGGVRKTLTLVLGAMTPEVEANYRLIRQREDSMEVLP